MSLAEMLRKSRKYAGSLEKKLSAMDGTPTDETISANRQIVMGLVPRAFGGEPPVFQDNIMIDPSGEKVDLSDNNAVADYAEFMSDAIPSDPNDQMTKVAEGVYSNSPSMEDPRLDPNRKRIRMEPMAIEGDPNAGMTQVADGVWTNDPKSVQKMPRRIQMPEEPVRGDPNAGMVKVADGTWTNDPKAMVGRRIQMADEQVVGRTPIDRALDNATSRHLAAAKRSAKGQTLASMLRNPGGDFLDTIGVKNKPQEARSSVFEDDIASIYEKTGVDPTTGEIRDVSDLTARERMSLRRLKAARQTTVAQRRR